MVGMAGFEPTTTSPPARCATKLRYIPKRTDYIILSFIYEALMLLFFMKKNDIKS